MKTTVHSLFCIVIRIGAVLMVVGIVEQAPTIFLCLHRVRGYPYQAEPAAADDASVAQDG